MSFKVYISVIVISLAICSYAFYSTVSFNLSDSTHYRIALVEPAVHPAIEEICQGFITTCNEALPKDCYFKRYNSNNNKILLRAQAEEILQNNFDLIFTIGVSCSVMIKELAAKYNNPIPQVFCSIDDPIQLNLSGPSITGICEKIKYDEQLQLLMLLQPTTKNVLLLYDPAGASGFEQDKQEIQSLLAKRNIQLQAVEVYNAGEIAQKISPFIANVDLVMILKDHTTVSALDLLISLCRRYQIPLLANDLNSGQKGALLAYGIREYDSGAYAAQKAIAILQEKVSPALLPISSVDNIQMTVNQQEIPTQGKNLNHTTLSSTPALRIIQTSKS